ncbi:MAG: oligosaccharide flippase family protein [Ginsengibacter sp.]
MNLFARFKKDYFNYLISIILPAIIAGAAVPILKNLLGAEKYGEFSLYFNGALICTAITTGWITQSIYRFYPSSNDKNLFARLSIKISIKTQLFFYIPIIIIVWYLKNDLFLGILICFVVFMNSMQFAHISIAQSSFLSKKTIYSETIRSVSYIIIAITFLLIYPKLYLYILFIAIFISYSLSVFYLRIQTRHYLLRNPIEKGEVFNYKKLIKKFIKYGFPLSMWIVFSYSLSYIDKLLILQNLGAKTQGNYQSVFDLLYRGLTILISPVTISLLPLLTQAYEKFERNEIRQLMKKIIFFELGGLLVSSILYWLFGASLLFEILKVPDTETYRLMGFIILLGTFVWQIAIVIHQRFILKLKSQMLLYMIATAFLGQVIFYLFIADLQNPLAYPFGYLIASSIYLLLVSISQFPMVLKSIIRRVKFII